MNYVHSSQSGPARHRIAVLSSTRADYGHLYWVLRALRDHPSTDLLLYVTGTHLSKNHNTLADIQADGFVAHRNIEIWEGDDGPRAITAGLGRAVERFGAALSEDRPDAIVILGDRAEALAVALAAVVVGTPIAHLHGGETSQGSLDEHFRHAITKLAAIHFPATRTYGERIGQLGEAPEVIHAVGAPGLDHVRRTERLSREDLAARLGLPLDGHTALVTFHPETTEPGSAGRHLSALLSGIDAVAGLSAVFTGSNADEGGALIDERLREFCAARPERYRFFQSLGTVAFLSCLEHMDVVVGNSSSGIIEAPSFGVPTVNVGARQAGRVRATSVIDVGPEPGAIREAIRRALSPEFRSLSKRTVNPYDGEGDGSVSERIVERLVNAIEAGLPIAKRFVDAADSATAVGAVR